MLFIEYPKCSTCQKAKKWLETNGVAFEDRHIKENNPTIEELKAWHEKSGLPLRLRDTGRFDPACIGEVCEKAVNDGAIIVNPAYLSKEDVAKLLLAAR